MCTIQSGCVKNAIWTGDTGTGRLGLENGIEDIVNIVAWKYGREKSKEDREDFAQQGWLALTKKKKDLEGLTPAEARRLAYIICRNAVIDLAGGSVTRFHWMIPMSVRK